MRALSRRLRALEAAIGEPERRSAWATKMSAEMIASCRWMDTNTDIEERGDPIPDAFTMDDRLRHLNQLRVYHDLPRVVELPTEYAVAEEAYLAATRAYFNEHDAHRRVAA